MHGNMNGTRTPSRAVLALGVLLSCSPCALALDPSLDVSQYVHTAWRKSEGFASGMITSFAQTSDGYLWLGTEFGLLRFDGVKAVPWQQGQHLPDIYIRSLLVTRDGTLWIGTLKGLASWKDAKLTEYPQLAGNIVDALLEDREGTVWAAGSIPTAKLCTIRKANVQCYGADGRFGQAMEALYEDHSGNLWVGASTGLWRWKPGTPKRYAVEGGVTRSHALVEANDGALLIATSRGMRQLVGERVEPLPLPGAQQPFSVEFPFRDRDGGLWIGTVNGGVLHVHQGKTDHFARSGGLSSDNVFSFFEDRERNVWVATSAGLDRFREAAINTLSYNEGLSADSALAALAVRDGSVWLSTYNGLNRWANGQITVPETGSGKRYGKLNGFSAQALLQDDHGRIWASTAGGIGYLENGRFTLVGGIPGNARAMGKDGAGNLWFANQSLGLFRLSPDNEVQKIPWATLGTRGFATSLTADPSRDGLWLGFYQGGVAYFAGGQIRASYAAADGLGEGYVGSLRIDEDRTLWAATQGGLSRLKDGHIVTLNGTNGLPCDAVHWSIEDAAHSLWLYMACGLVRIDRADMNSWAADPNRTVQPTFFDSSDGVDTTAYAIGSSPIVARSSDGKLWYVSRGGVSVIDPGHLPFNRFPPPVHIEQITADRKTYDASFDVPGDAHGHMRLPPLVRDLEIDFTALSFVAPEKNRFRVKLEGRDRDWQDIGNRRQAFYSNLSPGNYRFRVIASNTSGVWNEEGAFLDFSIAPAYYQSTWFRALMATAFMAMLWAFYQLRLRQLAREFNTGLEARVSERTRIARDLHDTLLQSFHGLLLRFQSVSNMLPAGDAKQKLESAIDQAAQAITEGRDSVQELRRSTVVPHDLAASISVLGQDLAAAESRTDSVAFRVTEEGTPRALHPILRDELYRIAGEALRNAFHHAAARQIEVEIRYDERRLRLRVRDDGKGIDPKVLQKGEAAGHFGLQGMRERSKLIGGKLTVWSELDSGTEVELSVPASHAYEKFSTSRRSWLIEKLTEKFSRKDTAMKS